MNSFKKRIGLLVVTLLLLLSISGLNLAQIQAQTPNIPLASKSSDSPVIPDAPKNGFDISRDKFLSMINLTLEDYEALPPRDKEIANRYINSLWGYDNGTFTQEEATAYIQSDSPETLFAPGNIIAFFDLFRWLHALYYYPSSFSIPESTDELFEIIFIARAPFLERILYLTVDLISDNKVDQLNLEEIYQPVDTGYVSGGNMWVPYNWRDVLGVYHWGMCYHWGYLSDNTYFKAWGKPGIVDKPVTVRFNYVYQKWIPVYWIFDPQFPGYWETHTFSFPVNHYAFPTDPIIIEDDDTTAPEIKDLTVQNNERPWYEYWSTPYIYSNAPVLNLTGQVLEGETLLGFPISKNSGIDGVTVEIFDVNDILVETFYYEIDDVHLQIGDAEHSLLHGGWIHPFTFTIDNPGEILGTGTFTANVTVKDNDNDRGDIDRLPSETKSLKFYIKPVATDVAPPVTTPTPIGTRKNELGWFTSNVLLQLSAVDTSSDVDFTEWSFDESIWFPYVNPIPITNEGVTTVFFRSTDTLGNQEPVKNITLMIDKTQPATQCSYDEPSGSDGWFISEAQIELLPTDDTSGIHQTFLRINSGTWLKYEEELPLSSTGTYKIEYYSVDVAGNEEEIKSLTIYVDTDPPDTDASIDGDHGLQEWFVSEVLITLTFDDSILGSGVAETFYSLDGINWELYTDPISVSCEGDQQTIHFYSKDIAGNVEDPEAKEFKIDTQAPTTEMEPAGTSGSNDWFISAVSIALIPEDAVPGSGFNETFFCFDTGEWIKYEAPFILNEEGVHKIGYYSNDVAGNEEIRKSSTIMIDKTAPEISCIATGWLGSNGWYLTSVEISLTASDTISSLASLEYSLDGGSNWLPYSLPVMLDSEGTNTIDYRAIDVAGNTATGSLTVFVDTVAPETTHSLEGSSGNLDWFISDVTLTLDALDATSGVAETQFSMNGAPWELYSDPIEITAEGLTVIQYKSIDNAGNEEFPQSVQLTIDKTPPSTDLTIGVHYVEGEIIYVTSETEFTLTAYDETSGAASTFYRISSGDWIEYTGVFELEGLDGTYIMDWFSVDVAGNAEEIKSETIELVSLSANSYLTDSEFSQIVFFDFIVHFDKKSDLYKLVATNPGQFYYNIKITNNWPISVERLVIDALIPDDFVLKGGTPIHVYLDGEDVTHLCLISDTTIIFSNLPVGSQLYVAIHLDYGLKKQFFETLAEIQMQNYVFDVCVNGESGNPSPGEELQGNYNAPSNLIGHQKKVTAIAGYVYDAFGLPVIGVTVELHDAQGLIASTTTDENGFYYFFDIDDGEYTIKIHLDGQVHLFTVIAIEQELTLTIFNLE